MSSVCPVKFGTRSRLAKSHSRPRSASSCRTSLFLSTSLAAQPSNTSGISMALQINLLHEQIAEKRQRQRDPLKLGMYALVVIGALMALFYMWRGYQTLEVKRRLSATQAEWARIEPKANLAQKRSAELNGIINTT